MKRSLVLVLAAVACTNDSPSEPEGARETQTELHALAKARVTRGMLARTDGYAYAVDVALLMIFAAREGDREMYEPLRDFAIERYVLDDPEDPYTRGFVLLCS